MNPDKATQVSNVIKSALSEILPDLLNLLQHYEIKGLELRLIDMGQLTDISRITPAISSNEIPILCTYWDPRCPCWKFCNPLVIGLDPEKTEQFCNDFAAKLNQIMPPSGQPIPSLDENYEVHLLLDPATAIPQQPMVCEWDSDTSQGNILQCSNP